MNNSLPNMNEFSARRAIEALRNGVPNKEAVELLGCSQPEVEAIFIDLLSKSTDRESPSTNAEGMIVEGGFGSGKSHLLEHLKRIALEQNFACSKIAISKETQLFNVDKVFKAAIDQGSLPDGTGHLVQEIAAKLNQDTEEYAKLFRWANSSDNGISQIFAASLIVYERSNDLELSNQIVQFWSGTSIRISVIRDGLRQIGQLPSYQFKMPKAAELHVQRVHFISELIKGAGYNGWVILLDEMELLANYSILQRSKSYSEVARWMGQISSDEYPGIVTVGTISDDFKLYVFDQKGDRDYVVPRLRTKGDHITASQAETGMRLINDSNLIIKEQDSGAVTNSLQILRKLYSTAYAWDAPEVDMRAGGASMQRTMRSHVRRAINEWDLLRLYPNSSPNIEETKFNLHYIEDSTFEKTTSDETDSVDDN